MVPHPRNPTDKSVKERLDAALVAESSLVLVYNAVGADADADAIAGPVGGVVGNKEGAPKLMEVGLLF